jgi:activator of HSP90 ATPase
MVLHRFSDASFVQVRKMIVESIQKLQAEAGVGANAPSSKNPASSGGASPLTTANAPPTSAAQPAKPVAKSTSSSSSSSYSEKIEVTVEFNAPAKEIFECFTIPPRVMAYTQSRAEVGTAPGAKLVLFDGAITGEIVSSTQNEKLVWLWRQSSW